MFYVFLRNLEVYILILIILGYISEFLYLWKEVIFFVVVEFMMMLMLMLIYFGNCFVV